MQALSLEVIDHILSRVDKPGLATMAVVSSCFLDLSLNRLWKDLDAARPLLALLRPPAMLYGSHLGGLGIRLNHVSANVK